MLEMEWPRSLVSLINSIPDFFLIPIVTLGERGILEQPKLQYLPVQLLKLFLLSQGILVPQELCHAM